MYQVITMLSNYVFFHDINYLNLLCSLNQLCFPHLEEKCSVPDSRGRWLFPSPSLSLAVMQCLHNTLGCKTCSYMVFVQDIQKVSCLWHYEHTQPATHTLSPWFVLLCIYFHSLVTTISADDMLMACVSLLRWKSFKVVCTAGDVLADLWPFMLTLVDHLWVHSLLLAGHVAMMHYSTTYTNNQLVKLRQTQTHTHIHIHT